MSFISENLQEMSIVHSTDRYTLIQQSENHKNILIEQSLHYCFVAEFRPPASKTKDLDLDLRLGTGQSAQLVCPGGENPKWYNQIHTYIHAI